MAANTFISLDAYLQKFYWRQRKKLCLQIFIVDANRSKF